MMRITGTVGCWMLALAMLGPVPGCGTSDTDIPATESTGGDGASPEAGDAGPGSSSSGGKTVGGASGGAAAPTGGGTNSSAGGGTRGSDATGGVPPAAGSSSTGGASATGGTSSTGGASATGGTSATGGASQTGGAPATGGTPATGGAPAAGGVPETGGAATTGGSGTGGASTTGGCKRGIAANIAPGSAFVPAVSWWYNWAINDSGETAQGMEFVPMIWGSATAGDAIAASSKFLLGFNEPNFFDQANLSAKRAAELWPDVEASAQTAGAPIVGPGMNFCGPADRCHGTDPYQYYKDFFAACSGCKVDYIAVHWYNCDLPSLIDYLEPGGSLDGFEQFDKPIWLTEFSCDPSASEADQERYMREAIPYLEANPKVFRYSWFSADPIPNAKLIASDGSPTALGRVYIDLEQSCK